MNINLAADCMIHQARCNVGMGDAMMSYDLLRHGSISRVDAQTKDELVLLCGVAESMSGN